MMASRDRVRRSRFLIITFLHVVIGELVPKGIALGHSERTALAVSAPVRGFFIVFRPLIWVLQRSSERDPARARPRAAGRRGRRPLRGRAEDAALALDRGGRDRAAGAGDALQGLRLRRQGGLGRDGAAARGGRALGRAAARGGARGGDRLAVHALPGLPRVARRDRRHPARARPVLGAARPRASPACSSRSSLRPALHRPGDEGPRRAARRVPADEPAHGDRGRRVRRRSRGSSRSRTCSRRSSARSRTSSTCPTSPIERLDDGHDADRRHVPDRRLQRAVRAAAPDRGLPHGRRLRLRPARPRARARRRGRAGTEPASRCSKWRARGSSGSRSSSSRTGAERSS